MQTQELNGPNYATWSEVLIDVLKSKNKFVFLDGTIKKPDSTDPLFPTWKRCNDFVLTGVRATISSLIQESIEDITDASVLCQELKDRYSHGKLVRIYQLHSNLFSFKQVNSSVSSCKTKLNKLLDDLALFQPISRCRSTNSDLCNAYATAIDQRTENNTLYFLQGLNEIMMLFVPKSFALIPFLSWTRHFQRLKMKKENNSVSRFLQILMSCHNHNPILKPPLIPQTLLLQITSSLPLQFQVKFNIFLILDLGACATDHFASSVCRFRLGHPSLLCCLHVQKASEICHFSKQRRLSFHNSTMISDSMFDMIDYDTWFPYSAIRFYVQYLILQQLLMISLDLHG